MIADLLFLRHLRTNNNLENIINGHSLSIPIIERRPICWDFPVNEVVSSPATRCLQTTECFSQPAPYSFTSLGLLLERDMGLLEGMRRREAVIKYPDLFHGDRFKITATPPDGESFSDFIQRVNASWEYLQSHCNDTVLICSHNQFLKALYFIIHKIGFTQDAWEQLSFPFGAIQKISLF